MICGSEIFRTISEARSRIYNEKKGTNDFCRPVLDLLFQRLQVALQNLQFVLLLSLLLRVVRLVRLGFRQLALQRRDVALQPNKKGTISASS